MPKVNHSITIRFKSGMISPAHLDEDKTVMGYLNLLLAAVKAEPGCGAHNMNSFSESINLTKNLLEHPQFHWTSIFENNAVPHPFCDRKTRWCADSK